MSEDKVNNVKGELKIFLRSINFDPKKALIREFDVFYRKRNKNLTIERFIESRIGWSNLLLEFGIDKGIKHISEENLVNNLVEFCNGNKEHPSEINRENYIKYYTKKNGISPGNALGRYYPWELLIKKKEIAAIIEKAKSDMIFKYGKEYAKECKIEKKNFTINGFTKYVRSNDRKLSLIFIEKGEWKLFQEKIGVEQFKEKYKRSDDEILKIIYDAFCEKGNKQPTYKNIEKSGLSASTINRRFEGWYKALEKMYTKYGINQEIKISPKNRNNRIDTTGEKIDQLKYIGLDEGPVNEQGVVGIFFKIHYILGFPQIIKGHNFFPDCFAVSHRDKKEKRVWIEFKFRSAQWPQSKKTPDVWNEKVQYLICWEHDSKDFEQKCNKVEVIELKNEILKDDFINKIGKIYKIDNLMSN